MEIICPAGNPESLYAAVNAGADSVYCGFKNSTNARNFPGLNFTKSEMRQAIEFAHTHNTKVLVAINTYPKATNVAQWYQSIDNAADVGAYAVILADIGLLAYAEKNHPKLRRHLSVQATASSVEAVNYFVNNFGVSRVVLPRVLTLRQIKQYKEKISADIEVFVYGGLCVMAEGKCSLSSYITGLSPNKDGVCSPAEHVEYEHKGDKLLSKLSGSVINTFSKHEAPGYPTICKGRYKAEGSNSYLFEEPSSLSILRMLPQLKEAGISALKIEGRQRGRAYVESVTKLFRAAVDKVNTGENYNADELLGFSEGNAHTTGAYTRKWF